MQDLNRDVNWENTVLGDRPKLSVENRRLEIAIRDLSPQSLVLAGFLFRS